MKDPIEAMVHTRFASQGRPGRDGLLYKKADRQSASNCAKIYKRVSRRWLVGYCKGAQGVFTARSAKKAEFVYYRAEMVKICIKINKTVYFFCLAWYTICAL